MTEIVRVLRLLEYTGTRKFVEASLGRRAVKGTHEAGPGNIIREAILGDFPEILSAYPSMKDLRKEHSDDV